jgi:hypothetical protein
MQDHALCRKFLLDRTRHVSSPFGVNRAVPDTYPIRAALFRASRNHMQASADPRRFSFPATICTERCVKTRHFA